MHCMHGGMAKGTSRAEATSNSEKIKPVALDIVKLSELKISGGWAGGRAGRQAGR